MRLIRQPEGSSLCGQSCVAMAAGVSLDRAVDVVGHAHGTTTKEVIVALRYLGVACADKLIRVSRTKPHLATRCVVVIGLPPLKGRRRERSHWMLHWDGKIYDPGGAWPAFYRDWRITSYLEING